MPLTANQTFAGYRIVRMLGSGAMGEVYLAEHPRLPRQDALKILATQVSSDADYRERFLREADLAATLWHPNIVRVNDRGEFNGQLWIAMDYVDGMDAGRLLTARYPAGMPVDLATEIVSAVADALDYSHRQGLLHRDVKPANIMVRNPDNGGDRRILLADFGIARHADDISGLTATNMSVGTVAYAAPEQLMGEEIDRRADQYALAATAYQLLTGSQLFPHSNPTVVISRHLNASPPAVSQHRPDLADLDAVLTKALSKDPADRYERCTDFARALADHRGALPPGSPPPPTAEARVAQRNTAAKPPPAPPASPPSAHPPRSRRRWLIAAAVAALVVVAGTTMWTVRHHSPASGPLATPTSSSAPSSAAPSSASPGSPPAAPTAFAAPAPDPNRPPNGNCPPACTRIPDSAWIAAPAIPLSQRYPRPPLGPLSEPVSNPRFRIDELCAAGPVADDERNGAIASRLILPEPPDQWQLQVQILHWRGDPWIAGQRASAVMDSAIALLRNTCSSTAPEVSVSRIAEQNVPGHPGQSLAAVLTVRGTAPLLAHEYLVSDLRNSTVVELAMWSTSPPAVDWPAIKDDQLLADMVAPLCTAYVNSCTA
jgi:serine/threonine protein kinase